MKRWLSEPLVHFLVLGALLFGGYAWLHRGESGSSDNGAGPVRITAKEIAFLTETWERLQQREPTREELHALVAGYLKEELLGREARAMGLDQNDLIIRRRLAQKVEFIVNDTSRLTAPTDDDLHRFYEANKESFQTPRARFVHPGLLQPRNTPRRRGRRQGRTRCSIARRGGHQGHWRSLPD